MEANPLTSGLYHIEISGSNGLALLAYTTDVLVVNDNAQWEGLATIGAYNMAFQQECHSLFSSPMKVKDWRGNWVFSTATSPKIQLLEWLQLCLDASAKYDSTRKPASQIFPKESSNDTLLISISLPKAAVDWSAICDAHIDTMFGSQAFLTDLTEASTTLYFNAETLALHGVVFTSENGQANISGFIRVYAAEGHSMQEFPPPDTISKAPLHEEWTFLPEE